MAAYLDMADNAGVELAEEGADSSAGPMTVLGISGPRQWDVKS
ncbi:MAG TPA: hypothetical protein VM287_10100 [Egibacteraceae bacterium]|nr:hypothetical protein [Egibacteraceae bacterium]